MIPENYILCCLEDSFIVSWRQFYFICIWSENLNYLWWESSWRQIYVLVIMSFALQRHHYCPTMNPENWILNDQIRLLCASSWERVPFNSLPKFLTQIHGKILVAFCKVLREVHKSRCLCLIVGVHIQRDLQNIDIEVWTIRNRVNKLEMRPLLFSIVLPIRVTLCWYTPEYCIVIAENQKVLFVRS